MLRSRLSYANVVSTLCLFIVLGGTSYAVATGSVDSREIKNNNVSSRDIRNNDVRSRDVRNGDLLARDFKRGELPAGARGPQGIQGPIGVPGTARAYGRISPAGVVDAARSKNVGAVEHTTDSGLYCITLASGINLGTTIPVASVDANVSAPVRGVKVAPEGVGGCLAPRLAIQTTELLDTNDMDQALNEFTADAGFTFVIP